MTTSPEPGRPDWPFALAHPAHFLALGFGSGLAPKAPGTAGTLAALPIYVLMHGLSAPVYWAAVALFMVAGVWICGRTGRDLGVHDHGGIVWDEIAAFLAVLPFAPAVWWGYLLAFALFRLFDIWKPFPIAWFDARVPGGLGVMLDDVLAAGYAVLCLMAVSAWLT
ncbi:phosphatidylglycerophosphatase A [Parasulfuritortus cantonensis]|uniref:Phosphatidylglycerophosphatase A n=1 Tax=Parasulfuritortus cantonensis TaxID=2528202 RepID=A0A4R1BSL7_9PROT|nr:phosphatidylglycerophosphatase A [Parasulfuritortus cantonensis]TCJ20225.1 phosphatidylglycerophosphatase A [Parasulfuritortus cantonensis]